ncbi:hypothetical protein AmDm5_1871 [Acetobacter malorum]|uniref:LysM domain-containing protein n=1 Tax=Acetobacter malorum TaxID=178901 RepID=A0A087PKG6_9PROT|nr:hypothetical protein [Acetobacter malorum]KFL87869.1 hypothetical protein AmDm5_1871 [Acetobacter malorum]OAG75978.1 hypothetical protein Amal_01748 [Acetobacter malorum]
MAPTVKVSAADGTLYHVACRELGDATQWWRIAQLNGMSDPDLSGFSQPVTLALPSLDQTQTAGIPDYTS